MSQSRRRYAGAYPSCAVISEEVLDTFQRCAVEVAGRVIARVRPRISPVEYVSTKVEKVTIGEIIRAWALHTGAISNRARAFVGRDEGRVESEDG